MLNPICAKKWLMAILLLMFWRAPLYAASNAWPEVSSIPEAIDGFFYTGEAFVGYRLAPTLKLFSSTNGLSWESHEADISPFYVGHDGHGTLLAMTASGLGTTNTSVKLWKTTADQTWTNVGEIVSGNFAELTNPSIAANEETLFIQFTTSTPSVFAQAETISPFGLIWKTYVTHQFTTSRLNPENFQIVSLSPDFLLGVGKPIVHGTQFISRASDSSGNTYIVTSTNGQDWNVSFSSNDGTSSIPSGSILTCHDSFLFLCDSGTMSLLTGTTVGYVFNPMGKAIPFYFPILFPVFSTPGNFHISAPDNTIYNGSVFIFTLDSNLYTSFDHAQTWEKTPLTAIRGVGDDGTQCLLADAASATNTVFYQLTYHRPVFDADEPVKMWFDAYEYTNSLPFPPTTNRVPVLFLDSKNTSSGVSQIECSRDLKEWVKYGLPRTNALMIELRELNSEPKMFFRLKTAQ